MAKYDGKFFRGIIGPLVFKTYHGQQLAFEKPENPPNQTDETKASAHTFGKASTLALDIRTIWSAMTMQYDGPMVNRLNSDVLYSIIPALDKKTGQYTFSQDSFQLLNGFEYNMNAPVRANFFVQPQVSYSETSFTVDVPEINLPDDLRFPKDATACNIYIAVGMLDFLHGRRFLTPAQSIEIKRPVKDTKIEAKQFQFEVEKGCLCLVIFYLQYTAATFGGTMIINSKDFNPSAILKAVIVPGTPQPKPKTWQKMFFNADESK